MILSNKQKMSYNINSPFDFNLMTFEFNKEFSRNFMA